MILGTALTHLSYLLPFLFASTHASRLVTREPSEYGVGFNLAHDYATASILYANGTAIDVAKVEGHEMYKQVILRAVQEKETSTLQGEMHMPTIHSITTAAFNATEEAFLPILQSLKLETENYIDTSLAEIYITISSPMDGPLLIAIRAACLALDMEPVRLSIPAWQSAIRCFNITSNCPSHKTWPEPAAEPDEPEQMLLIVEYTRAGLIAVLAREDCGLSTEERELRNFTLGSAGVGGGDSWEGKTRDLEIALTEITRPSFETGSLLWLSSGPGGQDLRPRDDEIAEVVLIGEDADDEGLVKALENVFGERWQVLKRRHDERTANVDPVFVAARGAAIRVFEDVEWITMDDCNKGPC